MSAIEEYAAEDQDHHLVAMFTHVLKAHRNPTKADDKYVTCNSHSTVNYASPYIL